VNEPDDEVKFLELEIDPDARVKFFLLLADMRHAY
jgi:hypothetical protein